MNNLLALSFVTLFLAACAGYTYEKTNLHGDLLHRDRFSSEQRAEYLRYGDTMRLGARRGLD